MFEVVRRWCGVEWRWTDLDEFERYTDYQHIKPS